MKQIKLLLILFLSLTLFNCSSDDESSISPSDPDRLSEVLVIPGAQVVNSPDMPASSSPAVAPAVSHIDTNISYSSGSQIIIPSNVASPTSSNIAGVYIQVKGASSYFNVPINPATFNGTFTVPVDLPLNVGAGDFILVLKFYDVDGNISAITEIQINVTKPTNCDTTKVSGGQGLTSNIFNLPNNPGIITISYNTYVVRDKIDVFQNGVWIGGTGSTTDRTTLRRPLSCAAATQALGYVGEESEFIFAYDPSAGREIEVVVSGCENGGTLWEYTFSCPEQITSGSGNFTIDGSSRSGTCVATDAAQCTGKNVVISSSNGDYVILYNVSTASSGTFPFVVFDDSTCDPYLAATIGSNFYFAYSNSTGSYTKTGARSLTFTTTFRDINDIQHTVSGSGSY